MEVTREEILHIARLADLNLSKEEVAMYQEQLQDILNFANIVNNAPIDGLKETIEVGDSFNRFRKDEVIHSENREELLQNAPDKQEGMFKIPKVLN